MLDKKMAQLLDDMLAKGWENDPDENTRPFAYISVGGYLVVYTDDGGFIRYRLEED